MTPTLVALAWRVGLNRMSANSADLLCLRLLPAASGLLISMSVVLPAFLTYEPPHEREAAGPLLVALAALSALSLILGIGRAWHAGALTRALLRNHRASDRHIVEDGQEVLLAKIAQPVAAVIGTWHPQILTAESLRSACSKDEFQQVIAHEVAHIHARDNLKLLILLASPDVLAWTPLGSLLTDRWRAAAEREADQRATGDDRRKRLALASALVKVARLLSKIDPTQRIVAMPAATDDVPARVRQLLDAPAPLLPAKILPFLGLSVLLIPIAAVPLHARVHELLELLVRL